MKQTIISKKDPLKFYLALAISLVVTFALGTLVLWASIGILSEPNVKLKDYLMPLFALAFYALGVLASVRFNQNVPKIKIDINSISFDDKKFNLSEVKKVILTGKVPFRFLNNIPKEGTILIFNDETEKVFFDDFYENSAEMKSFLNQVVVKKQKYIPQLPINIDIVTARFGTKEIFKGSQFTSVRGIGMWLAVLFAVYYLISGIDLKIAVTLLIFVTIWFIIVSLMMNYFEISERYLIVKNHNYLRKSKVFELSSIKEVVFEMAGKGPNSMRIISSNFDNNLYLAATLSDSMWLKMKLKLESKGIKVRNECI